MIQGESLCYLWRIKWHWDSFLFFFTKYLDFSLSVSFHQRSILTLHEGLLLTAFLNKTFSTLYGSAPFLMYRGADKSLARRTSRCILFDGKNISFDVSLVIYIKSTNIPPIMIINRIYEHQNLLSLQLVSFLVGLRTYQHPCTDQTQVQ